MGIEGQVKFLGKIPLTSKAGVPEGFFANSTWLNLQLWLLGFGLINGYMNSGPPVVYPHETIVVDKDKVSIPKKGEVVVFSRDQINKQKVSVPTLIPGVRLHLTYK